MTAALAHDLLRLLLVGALCGGILALAETLRRLGRVEAEWTRKLVHVFVGLTATAFPWVFEATWSVALLCAFFAGLMEWARRRSRLLSVHGVARPSLGAVHYPAAVALVFHLAHETPWIYVSSILVMALSDPAAAVVGRVCGRHVLRGAGDKTLEGSAAFLVSAFPCVYVPLLLTTPLTGPECAVGAFGVAALGAGLEAVARSGSDNLSVPLGTCFALMVLSAWPPGAFLLGFVAVGALARLVWVVNGARRRTWIADAVLGHRG